MPSAPVRYNAGSLRVLPETVDLSCSTEGASLLFPLGDGQNAQLQMNLPELRQWLSIVHRQFITAGWPADVWPEWFTHVETGRN